MKENKRAERGINTVLLFLYEQNQKNKEITHNKKTS